MGPANLLRRLAFEYLSSAVVDGMPAVPAIPRCHLNHPGIGATHKRFGHRPPGRTAESVRWFAGSGEDPHAPSARPIKARWLHKTEGTDPMIGRTAPVGRMRMPDGLYIDVYLEASGIDPVPELSEKTTEEMGALVILIPPASIDEWGDLEATEAHLGLASSFMWLRQPPPPAWVTAELAAGGFQEIVASKTQAAG